MILDNNLILSGSANATTGAWTGQSMVATAGTPLVSTNTIDTAPLSIGGNQAPGWGKGEPLYAVFDILVAVLAAAGAATVTFQVIESDSADLSSPNVLCESQAFPKGELTIGKQIVLPIARSTPRAPKRYLGVSYLATTNNLTAGNVVAAIVHDVQDLSNTLFTSGFSVT